MAIGTPARRSTLPHRLECTSIYFCPSGTGFRPPAKLGRLRGVRQGGAGYGAAPDNLMPKPLRGFGPPSTALPPGGKARISVADGAAKLRPAPDFRSCCLRQHSGPPCIPPEAPPKNVFNYRKRARATRLVLRELPSLAPPAQVISLRDA